jgi:hypothetical protein
MSGGKTSSLAVMRFIALRLTVFTTPEGLSPRAPWSI